MSDKFLPPSSATSQDLVAPYIRHLHHLAAGSPEDEESERVAFWIGNLVLMEQPERAWPVIVEVIEQLDDERLLDLVGAGGLEVIVRDHGPKFIERIETHTRESWRFRRALGGVWDHESPVRERIDALLHNAP